mmetsp:Transcript_4431/g.10273  ORF Transcript_4431/g.10273 Transcript_4431/m.10273 type:complete len:90 (+) Transcript_4431:216-485(+)
MADAEHVPQSTGRAKPPLPQQTATPATGRQGQDADCMGCRMMGGLFGVGGSLYLASALLQSPAPAGAHRAGIVLASGMMFAFGVARALL